MGNQRATNGVWTSRMISFATAYPADSVPYRTARGTAGDPDRTAATRTSRTTRDVPFIFAHFGAGASFFRGRALTRCRCAGCQAGRPSVGLAAFRASPRPAGAAAQVVAAAVAVRGRHGPAGDGVAVGQPAGRG